MNLASSGTHDVLDEDSRLRSLSSTSNRKTVLALPEPLGVFVVMGLMDEPLMGGAAVRLGPTGKHLGGAHLRAGRNLDPLLVACRQHLQMRATDVDDQDSHAITRCSCANQPGGSGFVIAWYIISSLRSGGPWSW